MAIPQTESPLADESSESLHSKPPSLTSPAEKDTPVSIEQEEPDESTDPFGPAPDGGLRAWLVAAGAGCLIFSCMGFANSFGVFQEYLMTHQLQGESADKVAWIGSLSAFLPVACGTVGGPLFDRYGTWIIRPAAILYLVLIMVLSICTKYAHFMVVLGVLMGIAMGGLQFPAFASVSQYFDKKRAAALGIAISGSSLGGVVFPIVLSKMLNGSNLGFGWSIRIMGFMVMPFVGFAVLTLRPRVPPRKTQFFVLEAFHDRRYVLLIAATFCVFIGLFTPLFFLPSYAVSRGIDPTLASYFLAITNAASTFGRIIPGFLADKYGRLNIYSFGSIVSGVTIICLTKVESTAAFVVYSIALGFSTGTIVSGASAAFSSCTDKAQNLGTVMGMGMGIASLGFLTGPPASGAMLDHYGGFLQATIFSGVACIGGGVIAFGSKAATSKGLWGQV